MSAYTKLQKIQQKNRSLICLGLDLDPKKMPSEYSGSTKGMFEFAHRIIDATADQVCAYKPNLAFYEHHGSQGFSLLQLILDRIPDEVPVILDGKRGDIGNTANHYARSLFDHLGADWVTINPYMGYDSMRPFLEYKDKGSFVLCLTSNAGSKDFQLLQVDGRPLYMEVAEKVNYWNKDDNCGIVVGATHPEQLSEIRAITGDMPILIPGVGAQGGSLEKAVLAGTDNFTKPAVVNVSRSVLYASQEADFAQRARQELVKLNGIVNGLRKGEAGPRTNPENADNAASQGEQRDREDRRQDGRNRDDRRHKRDRNREDRRRNDRPYRKQNQDHRGRDDKPQNDQTNEGNRGQSQGTQPDDHQNQKQPAPKQPDLASQATPPPSTESRDQSQATNSGQSDQ